MCGDSENPALNNALGEIATPEAIARLVFVLYQDLWAEQSREPARKALIKVGKKAHAELLKALKTRIPTNLEHQTSFRREILAVLSETGDEQCISAIEALLTSDPLVAQEAKATIEAIAKRCEGVEVSPIKVSQSLPVKQIAKTGDPYVDECFQIGFDELYEDREWSSVPGAKALYDAGNSGRVEEGLRLAEELRQNYPDFNVSYYWSAELYRKQERYAEARKALLEGLRHAKCKHMLCTAMGEMEWELQYLSEAVLWWIKSIVVQTSSGYATDYLPFLNLSYIAEGLENYSACSELRAWVGGFRFGSIRLKAEEASEFYLVTRRQETAEIRLAIELLEKHYL